MVLPRCINILKAKYDNFGISKYDEVSCPFNEEIYHYYHIDGKNMAHRLLSQSVTLIGQIGNILRVVQTTDSRSPIHTC